jgi:lipopolysaccharide/colanic/teichoic acid biosynthesis glycosyltransferase
VIRYTEGQRRRLDVRPGLTGLSQVSGRADLRFEQQVELDLRRAFLFIFMTYFTRFLTQLAGFATAAPGTSLCF